MLKQFKFKGDESKFFYISDLHHGHNKSFLYGGKRGYNSIQEHDKDIVRRWNEVCDNTSIVFNLGDVQFDDGKGEKFLNLHRQLNFAEVYILTGNHCSGMRTVYIEEMKQQFPNSVIDGRLNYEVYPLIKILDGYKKIVFLPTYVETIINNNFIVLCHYPLYSFHNQGKLGTQLSGHVHGNCALTHPNTGKGMRLDVSYENFKHPISLKEVKRILSNRTDPDIVDHH